MRITQPKEFDDELLDWLRESFHQMAMQERLAGWQVPSSYSDSPVEGIEP